MLGRVARNGNVFHFVSSAVVPPGHFPGLAVISVAKTADLPSDLGNPAN